MTLLARVAGILTREAIPFSVIGATAMAVHGVARSTLDIDILTSDPGVLQKKLWKRVKDRDVVVEIRYGDAQDPLAGAVRFSTQGERPVDLLVVEAAWIAEVLGEASTHEVLDATLPVAGPVGLILLKLYAGGPQDVWDIRQLLAASVDLEGLLRRVEVRVSSLPPHATKLWRDLVED